jgi:hypothetical protein
LNDLNPRRKQPVAELLREIPDLENTLKPSERAAAEPAPLIGEQLALPLD